MPVDTLSPELYLYLTWACKENITVRHFGPGFTSPSVQTLHDSTSTGSQTTVLYCRSGRQPSSMYKLRFHID
jgi:hypothetical protein